MLSNIETIKYITIVHYAQRTEWKHPKFIHTHDSRTHAVDGHRCLEDPIAAIETAKFSYTMIVSIRLLAF